MASIAAAVLGVENKIFTWICLCSEDPRIALRQRGVDKPSPTSLGEVEFDDDWVAYNLVGTS